MLEPEQLTLFWNTILVSGEFWIPFGLQYSLVTHCAIHGGLSNCFSHQDNSQSVLQFSYGCRHHHAFPRYPSPMAACACP